jgi:hypothetical protein
MSSALQKEFDDTEDIDLKDRLKNLLSLQM